MLTVEFGMATNAKSIEGIINCVLEKRKIQVNRPHLDAVVSGVPVSILITSRRVLVTVEESETQIVELGESEPIELARLEVVSTTPEETILKQA